MQVALQRPANSTNSEEECSLNASSIKTMLLGTMLMLFGNILMASGSGGVGFFFALVGLMFGISGFRKA